LKRLKGYSDAVNEFTTDQNAKKDALRGSGGFKDEVISCNQNVHHWKFVTHTVIQCVSNCLSRCTSMFTKKLTWSAFFSCVYLPHCATGCLFEAALNTIRKTLEVMYDFVSRVL